MFVVALVEDADPSAQGPDAHPAVTLKGIVPLIGVLHGGGTVMRGLIQALEAFFRDLLAPMLGILLELRPQARCRVAETCRSTLQASCEGRPKRARSVRSMPLCTFVTLLVLPCAKAYRLTAPRASRYASWVWRNAGSCSGVARSLSLAVMICCMLFLVREGWEGFPSR